jgi:hypothetical protein
LLEELLPLSVEPPQQQKQQLKHQEKQQLQRRSGGIFRGEIRDQMGSAIRWDLQGEN